MNFTGPLSRFMTGTYTVTRRGPATVGVDGRMVDDATPTILTIRASVQALSGRELQALTEGMRTTERRRLYTETRLIDTGAPDVVTIDDADWEVEEVEDWNALGKYFKCIVAKVGN